MAFRQSEERVLKLLVVGDSVSAGLRVPHDRKHDRWVAQLQRLLTAAELPVKVINCSVSSSETFEGLDGLPQYLKFFKPDMVICPLGGNDARKGRDLFQVLENMEEFVNRCTQHNIKPEHIVWGAGIPKTFPVCEGYRKTFLGALKEFEKRTGAKAAPLPDHILSEEYMDADKLHFTAEIQKDIAEFAYSTIAPIAALLWETKKQRFPASRMEIDLKTSYGLGLESMLASPSGALLPQYQGSVAAMNRLILETSDTPVPMQQSHQISTL